MTFVKPIWILLCLSLIGCGLLPPPPLRVDETTLSHAQAVATNAGWGNNVDISIDGHRLIISTDGIPNHERLEFYALLGGNVIPDPTAAQNHRFTIPLAPHLSDRQQETRLGPIGVAISGAVFFNPYEGNGQTVALDDNFEVNGVPFIDACNGHPTLDGLYHYHGVPYCITDTIDTAGQHSTLIGYMLDGIPVYGPQDRAGNAPTDLDACQGHTGPTPEFPEGVYHYHLLETPPYSIPCFSGRR
ncbi:MAG: YHYH protein [Chloroflexota bacterium]